MRSETESIVLSANDSRSLEYFETALKSIGYSVNAARDGREVLSCLRVRDNRTIAVVLVDVTPPERAGLELLAEIRGIDPDLPIIVIAETASVQSIVAAIKTGATDFLSTPVTAEDLRSSIARSLVRKPSETARGGSRQTGEFFVGRNAELNRIYKQIQEISWSDASVLILGETGSGKEVVARELHARSPRGSRRFVKLNCAALPSELVESELFGYERGAFTSAVQQQPGILEVSNGGTILLDEIGDMDVGLQAKLLHVLQDREFFRIGGRKSIQIDVRVIAATHRDLEAAVVEGSFREDLYYRLNVIDLHVPPLRKRKEDIPDLAEFFIAKHARQGFPAPVIGAELRQAMQAYDWPGNVRELENFVQKLIVTRDIEKICRDLLARSVPRVATRQPKPSADEPERPILHQVSKVKEQAEAEAILAALNATSWNRKAAAALLKTDYRAMLYKMKKLGIGRTVLRAGCPFPGAV